MVSGRNAFPPFLQEHPDLFFTMYKKMAETISHAEPNAAHRALAELEKMGKLSGVVTQNIDGLHQKAGSMNVVELHGSTLHNTCEKCRKQYDLPEFISRSNPVPHCDCGGIIKPDIVLYEESLDINAIDDAVWLIRGADMLIIGEPVLPFILPQDLSMSSVGMHWSLSTGMLHPKITLLILSSVII